MQKAYAWIYEVVQADMYPMCSSTHAICVFFQERKNYASASYMFFYGKRIVADLIAVFLRNLCAKYEAVNLFICLCYIKKKKIHHHYQ